MNLFKAALALFSAGMIAVTPASAGKYPAVGDVAPNFELALFDGSKVRLDDLRGQVIVLNFWATWCAPCREELPILEGYYRLRRDVGLRVFAIATEDSVPEARLRKVFAHMEIPAVRRMKGNYGILRGLPTNYVIDRSGVIRHAKAAAFDLDDLNEILIPLLREPAPPPAP